MLKMSGNQSILQVEGLLKTKFKESEVMVLLPDMNQLKMTKEMADPPTAFPKINLPLANYYLAPLIANGQNQFLQDKVNLATKTF